MNRKEENALILDFLPHGYPLEREMIPVAQAVGLNHYTLLQLVPRRGVTLKPREIVYIGSGKRDKISYILGRLPKEKLTATARSELAEFVGKTVSEREADFVRFFNTAEPVNTRLHQLELLPGFGKKHTKAILEERAKKPFSSFEDIRQRVKNLPDPKKTVERRFLEELQEKVRYVLFAR